METQQTVGERIRAARKAAGLTQRKLAAEAGVTAAVVSQWETGLVKAVTAKHLHAAAITLDVDINWLLNGGADAREALTAQRVCSRRTGLPFAKRGRTSTRASAPSWWSRPGSSRRTTGNCSASSGQRRRSWTTQPGYGWIPEAPPRAGLLLSEERYPDRNGYRRDT